MKGRVNYRGTAGTLILLLLALAAQAEEEPRQIPVKPHEVGGPTLLLKSSVAGFYVPAPTVETDVALDIRAFVVRGKVVQTFENPTDQCVETLYVFPLPENAAVDHLVMITAGRRIVGEIHEREEARRIYEEAKESGKRASLLQQERPNVFTVELSSLSPRESVRIEIGYQQVLDYVEGRYATRVPLVVGPRYDPDTPTAARPVISRLAYARRSDHGTVNLSINLDSGIALAEIDSPTHAIEAIQTGHTTWSIQVEDRVAADRDFVLRWKPRLGSEPIAAAFTDRVARADGSSEFFTLLTFMPPAELSLESLLSRELVIIIDTSGSMSGQSLDQAKRAVSVALERLDPADRFWLIEFNSVTRAMTPTPVWADSDVVTRALSWINGLRAEGGTEILPALERGLENQEPRAGMMRQVIFLTDGMVSNEHELAHYVRGHIGDSRLFTVGIGSAPNGHLMRSLARQGRGTHSHLDGPGNVTESMGELFAMIERPALTDIEVSIPDAEAEIHPRSITDLYAGQPVVVTIRHARPIESFSFAGRQGGRTISRRLAPPVRENALSGIEKLWAHQKIMALEGSELDAPVPGGARDAIVKVAVRHGLVSSWTSLVAVDHSLAGSSPELCDPVLVPLEIPHGMEGVFPASLPGTATQSHWLLIVGLLLLTTAATWEVVSAEITRHHVARSGDPLRKGERR